jgi:uncharacterized protein YbjT (DUF2867 family)
MTPPLSSPIVVTGGTGTLGRLVVTRLQDAGQAVRVLSRHAGDLEGVEYVVADLDTGEGVEPGLAGASVIVHCAGSAKGDEIKAQHLVRAARSGGAHPHLVNISVVGADTIPVVSGVDRAMFGYFAAKRGAEEVIAGSGLPWTTLRATQFHELAFSTAEQLAKLWVLPVPVGFRFQPVDSGEVADRLVELALGPAAGLVPDLAGPRAYAMAELVRSYLRAVGKRRPILPVSVPGQAARAIRHGANLALERAVGRRSWEDYLNIRITA